VATRFKSWLPRRGNCVDHNVRSEYMVQSRHHCQQSEAGNERERRRSVNRRRRGTLVVVMNIWSTTVFSQYWVISISQIDSTACFEADRQERHLTCTKILLQQLVNVLPWEPVQNWSNSRKVRR